MKKELSILSLALTPALAFAAGTALKDNKLEAKDCTLLTDDLKVSLSSGVYGATNCNTSAGAILLGACHTGGRVTERTSKVDTPIGCGGTNTAVACTGTTSSTVKGSTVPTASTNGGSIKNEFPGGNCDTAGSVAASAI